MKNFDIYISMISVLLKYTTQVNYLLIFDRVLKRLIEWEDSGIVPRRIGVSVYLNIVEKFVKLSGFRFCCFNSTKGKDYKTKFDDLIRNANVRNRYEKLSSH